MEINHVERFLSGKRYHLDEEGIQNMLNQVKAEKGEEIYQQAKENVIKKEVNEIINGDVQLYYVTCTLNQLTTNDEVEAVNQGIMEYKLNPEESKTVMDMVQDIIDRGMIASGYETDKLEEIIDYSTDDYEQHRKGVQFEVIVRVIG